MNRITKQKAWWGRAWWGRKIAITQKMSKKNMFSQQFIQNFTRVEKAIRALDTTIRTSDGTAVHSDFFIRNFEQRILDEITQLPDPMHPTAEQIEECTRKAYKRFLRFFGWNAIPTAKEGI